jgi:hypothetical protein
MMNTLSRRKRSASAFFLMLAIWLALAPITEAATYYVVAKWVRTNLLTTHGSYGVFIARSGHSNVRLYYMTGTNTGYYLGNSQCGAIASVVGPGYINDPKGMYSAYVPSGWIGMGICASTSTLAYLRVLGYNINDSSRWRLYYDR